MRKKNFTGRKDKGRSLYGIWYSGFSRDWNGLCGYYRSLAEKNCSVCYLYDYNSIAFYAIFVVETDSYGSVR